MKKNVNTKKQTKVELQESVLVDPQLHREDVANMHEVKEEVELGKHLSKFEKQENHEQDKRTNDPLAVSNAKKQELVEEKKQEIKMHDDVFKVVNPIERLSAENRSLVSEQLINFAQSLMTGNLSIEVQRKAMSELPSFIDSIIMQRVDGFTPEIELNISVMSAQSLITLSTDAIQTRDNWPRLYTLVHYHVRPMELLELTAAPRPNYEVVQKIYPQNESAMAVILNQKIDSVGDNGYFDGSSFQTAGDIVPMIGVILIREGLMESSPVFAEYMVSNLFHFAKHFIEATKMVVKDQRAQQFRIDDMFRDYKADVTKFFGRAFPDFIPPPPYAYHYWNSSYIRQELDNQFLATVVNGVRSSRTLIPDVYALNNLTFYNAVTGYNIDHSVDFYTAVINKLNFDYVLARLADTFDFAQVANNYTDNSFKYIPDSVQASITVKIHREGKRALEIMTAMTTEFLNDEMLSVQNMLEHSKIAENQDSIVFKSFRDAIITLSKTGHMAKTGADPTLNFQAKIDANPSLNDIIQLLVHEQFYLLKNVSLIINDYLEISGEAFVDWLNNIILIHLFPRAFAPTTFSAIYAQSLRMYGLTKNFVGRFSDEINLPPIPSTVMNTEARFANDLKARPAEPIRQLLWRVFEPLEFDDDVPNYDPVLMRTLLELRMNPWVPNGNIFHTLLYQRGHGPDLSNWGRELKKLLDRVSDFVNAITYQRASDKKMLTGILDKMRVVANETNEAVAGVIGNLRLMQVLSSTHFYSKNSFMSHRAEWLAEYQDGYYAFKSEEITNIMSRFGHVGADGIPNGNVPARKLMNYKVVTQSVLMNPPNVLSFIFNVALAQDISLIMDPIVHMERVIAKTWRMRQLFLINLLSIGLFEGSLGRTNRYMSFCSGTYLKKSIFNNVISQLMKLFGQEYPQDLTNLSTGAINFSAHLSFDLGNVEFISNGVTTYHLEADDYVYQTILIMIRQLSDATIPLQHLTNLVLFKREKNYQPKKWSDITGEKVRVLRLSKFVSQLAAPFDPAANPVRDEDGIYMAQVSNDEYTIQDQAHLTVHRDNGNAYSPGRAYSWMNFNDIVALNTPMFIQINDLWDWPIGHRKKLCQLVEDKITLYVSGLFRYKYSPLNSDPSYHELKVNEWFDNPNMFSTFPCVYTYAREEQIAQNINRKVQPIILKDDGIVWKNPFIANDYATTNETPNVGWFFQVLLSDAELANLKRNPADRLRTMSTFLTNKDYQRLYSRVPFVLSGERGGNHFGVTVNDFTLAKTIK